MPDAHDIQPDRRVRPGDRVFHALVAAALVAVAVASLWREDVSALPPTFGVLEKDCGSVCMLRRMTGMPCPTCGATRSFRALGQGAWREAVAFHPLGPVYAAMLLVVLVRSAGVVLAGREWLNRAVGVLLWMLPVVGLATLAVYVVRMVVFFADGTGAASWEASPMARVLEVLG